MGRAPPSDTTEQIGKRAMLDALERIKSAFEDGSIKADDFYFKFATAHFKTQSGRCNKSSRKPASYEVAFESEIVYKVESVFEDVENGDLREEGYFFELTTPYYSFTSGEYPPQDTDGCTSLDDGEEFVSLESHIPNLKDVWNKIPSLIQNVMDPVKRKYLHGLIKSQLDDFWNGIPSFINDAKEPIKRMHPPSSIKKVPGLLSRRPFRIKVVLTVAVCTMLVHADASPIGETEHPLTLTAGKDGTIPFKCSNDHQSDGEKYYSVQFEGKDRPFYANGDLDPEGLVSPDQVQRFSVVYVEDDSGMSIEIHIESVSLEDQGTYIFMTVTITDDQHEFEKRKIEVIIHIPPGPAACFIQPSINMRDRLEIHCHSKPGNGNGTLACFQKGEKIPYIGKRGIVHRRVFWLESANGLVSCCAHELKDKDTITEDMCKQYTWPKNNVINNPLPTEKVPSEMAPVSRPNLSNDDDIIPPRTHTTVHSGSSKSYQVWQKAMLSLMAIVAYASACIFNI